MTFLKRRMSRIGNKHSAASKRERRKPVEDYLLFLEHIISFWRASKRIDSKIALREINCWRWGWNFRSRWRIKGVSTYACCCCLKRFIMSEREVVAVPFLIMAALVVLHEPQVHGTPPRLQHCMSYDTLLGELQTPKTIMSHFAFTLVLINRHTKQQNTNFTVTELPR